MKKFQLYLILVLICLTFSGKSQDTSLPDEIWLDTGSNIYVQFCLPSVYQLTNFSDAVKVFPELLESLEMRIKKYDLSKKVAMVINQKSGESKIFELDNHPVDFLIPEDFKSENPSNYQEIRLTSFNGTKITCYYTDPGKMLSYLKDGWTKGVSSVSSELKKLSAWDKRKAIFLHYRLSGEQIQNTFKQWNPQTRNMDQLEIGGGTGIGFYKGRFLPALEGKLGLVFGDKGILKRHYFVNFELMYDFIQEGEKTVSKTGLFMDAGYKYNFTKNPDKANWYGFSVGYLVKKNAAVFDDHTWRLSVYRNISRNIELVPQIYFPNNFSELFPGLKVNISF
jgi:hypothetical protein